MNDILNVISNYIGLYNQYIGGYLIMILLVPVGFYFTIKLKFLQITKIKHSLGLITGKYDNPNETGDISHFRALTTALSATIGTGNIVGVALAIYYGGPGAIFWMWVTGFVGMITKFVECTLSLKFRKVHEDGSVSGGPMYFIEKGLASKLGSFAKVLAILFAAATVISSLGIGNMAQSNSMAAALFSNYSIPKWISGFGIAFIVFLVIVGGIKRIARVTSRLVPVMTVFYVLAALIVIVLNIKMVPSAFYLIFHDAFTGTAAAGGFIGSTFMLAARWGIARGLFSNEAGQGSAAIAHAAAKTSHPVREGLVASIGPFIDTLLICTMTAFVIIFTGKWSSGLIGAPMTIGAFSDGLSAIGISFIGRHIVALGLLLFSISTAISWSYYGDRAAGYLFGKKAIKPYRIVYCVFLFLGAIWGLDLVWSFSDMAITLMTIPNLIALILLRKTVFGEVREYFKR